MYLPTQTPAADTGTGPNTDTDTGPNTDTDTGIGKGKGTHTDTGAHTDAVSERGKGKRNDIVHPRKTTLPRAMILSTFGDHKPCPLMEISFSRESTSLAHMLT